MLQISRQEFVDEIVVSKQRKNLRKAVEMAMRPGYKPTYNGTAVAQSRARRLFVCKPCDSLL